MLQPLPSRRRLAATMWVSCLVAAVFFCLLPPDAPAATTVAPGMQALPEDAAYRSGAPQTMTFLAEDPLLPQQYVPLTLRDHYRLPPWSGTARFGFGVAKNHIEQYDVSPLGADWYLDFWFRPDPPPLFELEYVQIVRLSETGCSTPAESIVTYAQSHPGTLWLIGNEPDAPAQDCVTPWRYAQLYHELHSLIKGADPTAKIAIGGVVQATPLRLLYLDRILQSYQNQFGQKIPVDVWNVHGFILQEKKDSWGCQIPCGIKGVAEGELYSIDDHDNMDIFHEQIRAFRIWMNDHGERNKPLIVSEYGILFPEDLGFDEARVEAFMLATFDYFMNTKISWLGYPADDNRLVQAWNWYSLDDDQFEGYNSHNHLLDPSTKQLTALGRAYRDYTGSLP